MLLVFFLLLPLVIVPFLVEWDNRWFKRLAYLVASVQLLVMLFKYVPEEKASLLSNIPQLANGIQLLIKMAIHIF